MVYQLLILLLFFFLMEGVAWFTHKYLMHGPLWFLHRDHHVKSSGNFERNDMFFLVFAIPSWLGIMLGSIYHVPWTVAAGFGIALYGLVYFLLHDVIIHGRFIKTGQFNNPFIKKIRDKHIKHHSVVEKDGGTHFGLLHEIFKRD